ncbi:MAG: hypothetical protein WBD45_02185 [Terriglobales bacterium]
MADLVKRPTAGSHESQQEINAATQKSSGRTAWTAADYVKGGADLELEYAVLAKLCAEMLDASCVGLYLPGKRLLSLMMTYLRGKLQRMAASRSLGVV